MDAIAIATGQDHDAMGGNTAIIRLSQGEAVWLETYGFTGSEAHSNNGIRFTMFSGVLLYS